MRVHPYAQLLSALTTAASLVSFGVWQVCFFVALRGGPFAENRPVLAACAGREASARYGLGPGPAHDDLPERDRERDEQPGRDAAG